MNLDYNNVNLAELPHLEYLRRFEGRIMMIVRNAQTDGISHLELARKIGINRKKPHSPYEKARDEGTSHTC